MPSTVPTKARGGLYLFDVLSSAYVSLLFIWFEESKPFAWPYGYVRFWHPHAASMSRTDFLLFDLEVFLALTLVIFLGLWLSRFFSFAPPILTVASGLVVVAGYPVACLYRANLLLLEVVLLSAGVCFVLWTRRLWPKSTFAVIVLLIFYYGMCSFLGGGIPIESRPDEGWGPWDYAWLMYPAIAVAYALVWGNYFRRYEAQAGAST